jgi:putative transposase
VRIGLVKCQFVKRDAQRENRTLHRAIDVFLQAGARHDDGELSLGTSSWNVVELKLPPMARRPRLELPGFPMHIVQRGHKGLACFFHDEDFSAYREALRKASVENDVAIHAYVLMINHVHLLVTATAKGSVSRMMQTLGRSYVRCVNSTYQRKGTLWEGRFKSCIVDTEHYLLSCYRHIELNPVRANTVLSTQVYRWSSYHRNALGQPDALIRSHAIYDALGDSPETRAVAYRCFCDDPVSTDDVAAIRAHVEQERALGSARFQQKIQATLARSVCLRGPGRPRKILV